MTAAASVQVEQQRQRRWTGALSMFGVSAAQSLVAAVSQIVLFGVAARELSPGDFGRFAAFATVAVWFALSDVGLNKALLARLGGAVESRRLTTTAFWLQAGMAAVLATTAYSLLPQDLRLPGTLAVAVAPLSVARATQAARQNGWIPAAWDLGGSAVVILLTLTIAAQGGVGRLTMIAASGLIFSRLLGGVSLLRETEGGRWQPSWQIAGQLWQDGRHFLAAQLADLALLQGLPWVAMWSLDASQAGGFSAASKVAAFLPMLMGLAANSMLPAYADAWARNDSAWIRRTLARSSGLALVLSAMAVLLLILLMPGLLRLWLGDRVPLPSGWSWFWLAVWAGLQSTMAPMLAFFYGTGRVRWVAGWNLAAASAGLAVGALAARSAGASGLAGALAASYLLLLSVPVVLQAVGIMRTAEQ